MRYQAIEGVGGSPVLCPSSNDVPTAPSIGALSAQLALRAPTLPDWMRLTQSGLCSVLRQTIHLSIRLCYLSQGYGCTTAAALLRSTAAAVGSQFESRVVLAIQLRSVHLGVVASRLNTAGGFVFQGFWCEVPPHSMWQFTKRALGLHLCC
jgi:hypothetical protein